MDGLRVALADGSVVSSDSALDALVDQNLGVVRTEFGRFGRQVSGYSFEHLLPENGRRFDRFLVGSEGTLGIVLEAEVRLVEESPYRALAVLGFPSMADAADAVPDLLAFPLVACEGLDARELALVERKAVLRELLPRTGPIRFSDHVEEEGKAVYEQVTALDLEGIVGKKADSPYRAGQRSRDWVKVRAMRTDDFVVVGWTEPSGSRAGFGSLHLGQHDASGSLVYTGAVGTGFTTARLGEISRRLAKLEVDAPPFRGPDTTSSCGSGGP